MNKAKSLAIDPHLATHHHALGHNAYRDQTHDSTVEHSADAIAVEHSADATVADSKLPHTVDAERSSISSEVSATSAAAHLIGVAILEFGIIFHSVIIGITLGTTNEFVTLFIVIIFHQMFEGLGLGARLSVLPLAPKSLIPWLGAIAYGAVTPIGLAIGIGVRQTYNSDSATASYVTGIFDALSAGVLFYTGFVELLAHEFVFNDRMRNASVSFLIISVVELFFGAGIMALLGRWA